MRVYDSAIKIVLVGNTHRYASTHRVCRTDGHTYQSIKAQCASFLQQVKYFAVLLTLQHAFSQLLYDVRHLESRFYGQAFEGIAQHRQHFGI